MYRLTTEAFIKRAKEKHDNGYDYSKVDYKNNKTKVIIICKIHGEFKQEPKAHLSGSRCSRCANIYYTTNRWIEKAVIIHSDRYDYSKVDYKNSNIKITIICKIHGEFKQQPRVHFNGHGCPRCSYDKRSYNTNEWIEKVITIHGDKYDYSKVDYKGTHVKIIIICKIHGEFKQTPHSHLLGYRCIKCAGIYNYNTNEWIEKAIIIHNDKYDYSEVDYKNSKTKVIIICKIHGEFNQTPHGHLAGNGCSKCVNKYQYITEEWIKKVAIIHGDIYDYSKVDYKNSKTKVIIICSKHGSFKQTPASHLAGQGCPICCESKGEREVSLILKQLDIQFTPQKKFKKCRYKKVLPFDFHIPNNICIEYDGIQHHKLVEFYGGEKGFKLRKKRDKIKTKFCLKNKIYLIRIPYWDFNQIEKILYDEIEIHSLMNIVY